MPETIIDESELVLSELVANSLRHASPLPDGTIRVHWKSKNDVVELEVSDGGGQTTVVRRRPRGLRRVAACGSCAASPTSGVSSRTAAR